ncbi:MAG: UDP-N-acetylglucosamine 2-epimerase (non-hydrolyzing) [Phycisphaerae bacterium]|nr:UDP-N-acetylglucosamine 2-epimerase (non-hydrolyzing) [Phycisphaerae bacterium]
MRKIKILTVVGARPQFVKAAAISRAINKFNCNNSSVKIEELIVHTGQHYDDNMSKIFFDQLKIPHPEINLEVGSGMHGKQTGMMLEKLEEVAMDKKPDWMLIYGDTNSTLAAAIVASKLHIPIAHVEAGLRSFNRKMPEEVNRVVADHLSRLLLCPTDTAVNNLSNEGITGGVHKVGDVMYDSVLFNYKLAASSSKIIEKLALETKQYYLATIHRAENTDDPQRLESIIKAFSQIDATIVLPLHPRTKNTLGDGLEKLADNVLIIEPIAYLDMLMLEKKASIILTDSGGVQKEAYWAGVPCITLRDETEWIELVDAGVNKVVGTDTAMILDAVRKSPLVAEKFNSNSPRLYGDGNTAEKIIELLSGKT